MEAGKRPPSFNEEFRGLSDSQLERTDRAARNRSKLGKVLAIVLGTSLVVSAIAVGVYLGLARFEGEPEDEGEPVAEADAEPPVVTPTPEPPSDPWAETPPLPNQGEALPWPPPSWDGKPPPPSSPTPSSPTPSSPTPSSPTPPTPSVGKPSATLLDSSIHGKIGGVSARLSAIDRAVASCWTSAVDQGQRGEHTLTLGFTIRWNRKATGIAASGAGLSTTMIDCVEKAVPHAGWPEPRDLGEAKISRRWTLRSE